MLKNVSTFEKKFPSDFSAKAMSCSEPSDRNRFHPPVTRCLSPAWRWWSAPGTAVSAIGSLLFLPILLLYFVNSLNQFKSFSWLTSMCCICIYEEPAIMDLAGNDYATEEPTAPPVILSVSNLFKNIPVNKTLVKHT